MAEESRTVELKDDFYRDSFGKVVLIFIVVFLSIVLLVALSLYLYLSKPPPMSFPVADEWRVQAPVPLDQPYLSKPEILQWVSEVIPKSFLYDFNHYNDQLKEASQYFTANGWKIFLNQLNNYANYNNVQMYKLFVNSSPTAAPYILSDGLISGRYAWWVQMPINIVYAGFAPPPNKALTLQVLVVRVPTLNNLTGVGIDNVLVVNNTGNRLSPENG